MNPIGEQTVSSWIQDVTSYTGPVKGRFQHLYGDDRETVESRKMLILRALETFQTTYGDRRVIVSRAPGRINLLGNHIDHRGGYLNYVGISRDTIMVASRNDDDTVRIVNTNADRFHPAEFSIGDLLPPDKRGNWHEFIEHVEITTRSWENYIRAPILYLQDQHQDQTIAGMDIAVAGDVPIAAGLSSSSTLVVSTFLAASHFNNVAIPKDEQAEFCGAAEWYAGTRGGSGDHAAMLYAKPQALLHLRFFPLVTEELPFPAGFRVVACNSLVEHAPPGIFNERIASYEIGLMLIKQANPDIAEKLEHLRDLNPATTGKSVSEIYAMLRDVPVRASREQIRALLPDSGSRLDTLFSPHPEPSEGYRLRQVVMFGIAECARSARGGELLKADDLEGFGALKKRSHDGDRQFNTSRDRDPDPVDNRISDEDLNRLIETAPPFDQQTGGYDCSCEELDRLTDIASAVEGCVGAGLTGGGLGGCVLAIVREDAVDALVAAVNDAFYKPRGLQDDTLVCSSAAGACIV